MSNLTEKYEQLANQAALNLAAAQANQVNANLALDAVEYALNSKHLTFDKESVKFFKTGHEDTWNNNDRIYFELDVIPKNSRFRVPTTKTGRKNKAEKLQETVAMSSGYVNSANIHMWDNGIRVKIWVKNANNK